MCVCVFTCMEFDIDLTSLPAHLVYFRENRTSLRADLASPSLGGAPLSGIVLTFDTSLVKLPCHLTYG